MILNFFLDTLCPVFVVLALGYYAGWRGRIDNRDIDSLNVALMHFALPCSLFLAVARTSTATLRSQLPLLAVLTIAMLIFYAVQFFMVRRVFGSSIGEAAGQSLTVSFGNNVAIGLPLLATLYGAPGLLAAAVAILIGALLLSPITLVLLEYHSATTSAPHSLPGSPPYPSPPTPDRAVLTHLLPGVAASLRRPVVFAPLLALLVPLSGVTLPLPVVSSADLFGKATGGLALFLTGLILSAYRPRFSSSILLGLLLKNFAQPALVVVLLLLFRVHGTLAREAFLVAALPAGFFGTVFAARYRVQTHDTSSTMLYSTLIAIITIPADILLSRYLA